MKKTFNIFGEIVADEASMFSYEDTTPQQVSSFLEHCNEDDEIEFQISSPGGDVNACIAICNLIKNCKNKTTSIVLGLAASSASVIACACDELKMYKNSMLMVHLPWTGLYGNSEELRKTADVLDKYGDAIINVYKSKFNKSNEEILDFMKNETWITGEYAKDFGLNYVLLEDDNEIKIAACANKPTYKNAPKNINDYLKISKKDDNMPKPTKDIVKEPVENKVQETISNTDVDNTEKTVEDKPVETVENKVETVTLEECEKRVSGMQSTMAKQIDSLKKEHEGIVNDLKVQLEAKIKELDTAKNESISLKQSLDDTTKELQTTVSALEEKTKALETLNANVNSLAEELPTMEEGLKKCKTPAEKVAFLKSGKYKRN